MFNVINASGSFPIATTGDGDLSMAAAFDGTNYLVGIEYNQKNTANQINTYVGAQMLSPTGAKIGSLIENSQHGIAGSIAFDGTNYLIVWEDNEGRSPNDCNFAIYGQFISKAGAAVGTSFVISSGIEFDGLRTLSYGGGKYLVTYTKLLQIAQCENSTNRYIAGRLIETNGTMGTEFRISTGNGAQNTMAFDGTNFFVVWVEDSQDKEVRGRFVSTTGVLGTEISINASAAPSDNPLAAAFDGTNYLVVWNDEVSGGWDIFGQRISPTGALVGGVITITNETGSQMATGIAFDGTNYLVSWVDMKNDANENGICDAGESTCWDVYGKYISQSGTTVGSKFAINTDAGNQLGGVGGFADGKYFVAINTGIFFGVDSLQGGDVYGMFITPSVAEGSIQLSSATYSVSEAGPEVTITVTRTGGSSGTVGISYATSNGTATAGSDYTSASGTLSWTDGDTANKTFTVAITNDTLSETSETFTVTLSTPTGGATLGSPSSAIMTITDNDSPPNILTVIKSGTGSGEVTPDIGTLTWIGNQGTGPYSAGDTVVLTATPAFRSSFTVWKGCTTMLGNTCTVSMTTAKTVTATFVADIKYAVKVKVKAKGSTATGMITSDQAGISCPLDCTESYWKDEVVTLTATPPAGFMFSGWSGACIGTESTCTLTMTTKKSVSAVFMPYPALTVIKSGTGTGTITSNDNGINCGNVDTPDCSEVYTTPDTVTLTATPGSHSSFTVWKGCTTMVGNTCTVSMTAAKTVTATFVADTKYALKVVKSGTGTGTITSDPAGISCPLDCTESYWKNEVVTLTATPGDNSMFSGWSGACTGTQSTCEVTMTLAKSVTANFVSLSTLNVLTGASWSLDRPVTTATITWINNEGETVKSQAVSGEIQIIADPSKLTASDVQNIVSAYGGTIFAKLPVVGLYWAKISAGNEASFISSLRELVSDVFPNLILENKYLTEQLAMPRDYTYSVTNQTPVNVSSGNVIIDDFSVPMCLNCPPGQGQNPIFILKNTATNKLEVDPDGRFKTTIDVSKAAAHGDVVNYYSTNNYTLTASNAASNLCDGAACSNPQDPGYGLYSTESMYLRMASVIKGASDIPMASTINFSQGPFEYDPGSQAGWETYNQTNNWSSLSSVLSVLDSRVKGTDEAMVVMAAGNGSTDITKMLITEQLINPDAFKKVTVVGALDAAGEIAGYSNYSTYAEGMIYVKVVGETNTGVPINGTSFAAPQVQFLINKIREARPDLTPAQIRQIIFDPRLSPKQSILIPNDPDNKTMDVPVINDPLSQSTFDTAKLVADDLFPTGTPIKYTLTIGKAGTGSGTVTANPSGLSYTSGTSVTLTATPAANSTFTGWSGACSGTQSTCTIIMTANKSVTATFAASPTGLNIYYVIEGVYDAIPGHPAREGQVEVIASMTMPTGGVSQGNCLTPYTSSTRQYTSGATISVSAESVLSYTTITVKIYRNGVLWKSNTATATGFGNYAFAIASGTL